MLQFRLRTLFAITFLVGIVLMRVAERYREDTAEDALSDAGGCKITYITDTPPDWPGSGLWGAAGEWVFGRNRWLRWHEWTQECTLYRADDGIIQYVDDLPNVWGLVLVECDLSEAGASHIRDMRDLKVLTLEHCGMTISPESFTQVCKKLKRIHFNRVTPQMGDYIEIARQQKHLQVTGEIDHK